jgi:hypothetical protein
MTVRVDEFKMNQELHKDDRFVLYGPMWQGECNWCHEMSDPFDCPEDVKHWQNEHRCSVTVLLEDMQSGLDC